MIFVMTENDADEQGRKRIRLQHHQPATLKPETLAQGTMVDAAALTPPKVGPLERAEAWLTADGSVEFKTLPKPDDDSDVMADRLAQAEARIDALVSVAESKAMLTRKEIEDEVTRTREPVEDEPTRTR